jgi:hypothetical protein
MHLRRALRLLPAPVVVLSLLLPVPSRAGFVDVTADLDPLAFGITYGLGWGDFDRDGLPDCFVCRHYQRPIVYRNLGGGELSYAFFPPLFELADDHHGGLISDLDGDGDLDIYLTAGADAGASEVPKRMYRNDGNFNFVDVAPEWGLEDAEARGRAPSAMDLEGDGDVDIFVAKSARVASPNSLFLNDGNQNFIDIAAPAGVADDFGSVGGLWNDYDNDGDPDLLISGEEEVSFETRLYRNDTGVMFSDVTAQAFPGIGQLSAAAWGDYDNDGDLDLAVGEGDRGLFDAYLWSADSIYFYFNTRFGDDGLDGLTFTQTGDSASFDLALDGFFLPDSIHISGDDLHPTVTPFSLHFDIFGVPPFLPGQSTGFYVWTNEVLDHWQLRGNAPPTEGHTFAGVIKALNGEFQSVDLVAFEDYPQGPRGTRLWRNDGGVFTDVTAQAGISDDANVHQVVWVDIDQNGRLDLFVLNKGDTSTLNGPDILYRNLGGGQFVNSTGSWNLYGPPAGLGDMAAFEDYDLDGDLDVMMTSGTGPRFIAGLEHVRLYRNDGPTGWWLHVDLEGTTSTRDGYGAWVTCVSERAGRQVRYVTGNNWRGGQVRLDPWFGLGVDAQADTLRVEWPSGGVDVLTDVPAGSVTVVETPYGSPAPVVGEASAGPLALRARPNPTTGSVVLSALRRGEGPARLEIFDAGGRRVLARDVAAGRDRVNWDGRDAAGSPVAAGVYFVRWTESGVGGTRTADTKVVRLEP